MMRLETLEVSDFRKFDRPMRLDGLGPGLNVLCEPNEFGKSTLLAAIKAVLFERHRARNASVERMRHHRNQTFPVVGLGFRLPDGPHRIEKRFLHRDPYARLTLPDGTRVEGDAAEDRLQALLGFAQAGKQGARDETTGLWGALWCDQQAASRQPELQALGRSTLHACLEQELGTLAGNDRGGQVRAAVEADLSRLLDGRGAPRGRYKEVVGLREAAASELADLRRRRANLAQAISDLARFRRELAQAEAADIAEALAADIVAARHRRDEVLQHRAALHQARTDLRLAEQDVHAASSERSRRQERRADLDATRKAVNAAATADEEAASSLAGVEATLAGLRSKAQASEEAAGQAGTAARRAALMATLARGAADIDRLRRARDGAVELQAEVNRLAGELTAQPADDDRMRAVRAAERERDRAAAMLDAQATEVTLDVLPEGAGIRVDDIPTAPGHTALRITAETLLDIPGVGQVRIRPTIAQRDKLETRVASTEAALREALAAIGATDVGAAERLAISRRLATEALRTAEARLEAATPGDAAAGLPPGPDALRNHVAAAESRLDAELAAADVANRASLPDSTAAEEGVRQANAIEAQAVGMMAKAREALACPQGTHARLANSKTVKAAALTDARNVLARLEREDAVASAAETDAALLTRLEAAVTRLDAQGAAVNRLERSAPPETLEQMDARIGRLEAAVRGRETTVRDLRETIASLAAHVSRDEGDGLDEQVAAAERQVTDLDAEHAASKREAAVLSLLRDTLAEAEREARERYRAPVMRRLAPLLHGLFPGVSVSLDDDLRVTGLARRDGAEDLDSLSDGTREQVAVLLRIAYADLLLERGKPATVILDDALAYSDPDRRELMFDVLAQAAERMQILILTCRADAFSRLGGNRVRLVPA